MTSITLDSVVKNALALITENVPALPPLDLLRKADEFEQEAAIEASWDNYSTAAGLRWNAEKYRTAVSLRTSTTTPACRLAQTISWAIVSKLTLTATDQDLSESDEKQMYEINRALATVMLLETALILIDELDAAGELGQRIFTTFEPEVIGADENGEPIYNQDHEPYIWIGFDPDDIKRAYVAHTQQ